MNYLHYVFPPSLKVAACISTPIGNIQDNVGDSLKKVSDSAESALKNANEKVESATKLFDMAKDKLISWETKVKEREDELQKDTDKIEEIKDELGDSCLNKCDEGMR